MATEDWQRCAEWLVRCRILPEDHRATRPGAVVFDLAQALRDGVLICHLLNNLSPNAVDVKDFSPRPQLSQFLCLKNIRVFLQTCKKVFRLPDKDLFDPLDLFEVRDFRKVLNTLSKLSKTEKALQKYPGFSITLSTNDVEESSPGFPPERVSHRPAPNPPSSSANDEEDIYGNLPRMALENDLDDNEEIYDKVYQEEDDEIYQHLCTEKKSRGSMHPSELPPPRTKKDFCIKEIHDTEKNYTEALGMLVKHFITPLKELQQFSKADREIIFAHIEKLYEVHKNLLSELKTACLKGPGRISEVFMKYKPELLVYGNYCSNLPKAQEKIDEVLRRHDIIKDKIEDCERRANEGKFRLRDLLHVPMQRVLKYHLLLRELMKQTDKNDPDYQIIQEGLEAMMDLSLYVNEVKRDNETLQLINEIQGSIGDLQMPPDTALQDYGRLQKDGELRVKNHADQRSKTRYIFLFDKVMLMCKSKGETYNFKEAIILATYKIDEASVSRDTSVRGQNKWNSSFIMVKKENRTAYTFFAKTDEMRNKWMDAIKLALENAQPPGHPNFSMHTFDKPTQCDVCGKLLRGVFFQGYKCQETNQSVHKECIGKDKNQRKVSTTSTLPNRTIVARGKAVTDYYGNPNPGGGRTPLKFKKDDMIDILNSNDSQWYKGQLRGQEGWFPQQLVQLEKLSRKPSYLQVELSGKSPPPKPHVSNGAAAGYVNLDADTNLESYDWYVGNMNRETAVAKMETMPNGTFLVRVSENPGRIGRLSLSIKYGNLVRHIRVERSNDDDYYLADTKYFNSLPDLVAYYQENSLKDSFPGVDTTLLYPFKSRAVQGMAGSRVLGYAEAIYDYSANATTQLSFKRGDRIIIYSKAGSDKGWWKGENSATKKNGYFPLAYVREEEDDVSSQ